MGKPLLTDEMIERANRGEAISGPRSLMRKRQNSPDRKQRLWL